MDELDPNQPEPEFRSMRTIATFEEHIPADMLRMRLQADGVEVFLRDELAGTLFGMQQGISVQIPEEQLAQVQELVESDPEVRDMLVPPGKRCPQCSSKRTTQRNPPILAMAVAMIFFVTPLVVRRQPYCCNDCGFIWRFK